MVDKPDIVKKLREEEKLGRLHGQSQSTYEELEFPEELPKNTSDESAEFFSKDFENGEYDVELARHGSLSEDMLADEKELLFHGSSDIMLYFDTFGRVIKANKTAVVLSGYLEEEFIGKPFWKMSGSFTKQNLKTYLRTFKNTLMGKATEHFVCELNEKSGKEHVIDFSSYPIKENGNVTRILLIGKDVTEQKETEDRYRLIAESTSDLISIATFSFKPVYTYVSPSNTRILGYEPEELIGKNCFDFLHPDDRKNLNSLLKKYISMKAKKLLTGKEHEIVEKFECRFRDKSGNWRYLEVTTNLIGKEMLSIAKDVTEQKKKEDEIDSERKQMLSIFDSMDEIIYVSDPKTYEILYVNPTLQKTFNKKLVGETCYKAFQNKDAPCEFCTNHIIFKDENEDKPYRWEFHNPTVDRDYSITDRVIKWPDGRDVRFELAVDITNRKKAEEELKEAHDILKAINTTLELKVNERTAEVEKLLKHKDEFINQLGHDLKNPLGPLINLLPILEKTETDPKSKEMFEVLNRNVRHIKNLVVKTVELGNLNSPNVKLNLEDTNLLDEVNDVIKNNELLFEENSIEIDNKISDKTIIKADKMRLTELFDNLISNAVKYSPDGGTITIDTKQDKDFVTVSIKDTGIGIAEEQLSHVFDEFYKADESRHDFDSSGLGLSICKHIVEKQGGKIWAESKGEGKGTTMFFTLPVSSEKQEDKEQQQN